MSHQPVEIVSVENRRDHLDFCNFPYSHYQQDETWVPPLVREERRRWHPRHNASLAMRWQRRFIAKRNGSVVGRIAAIVDDAFSNRWFNSGGMFGFFECENRSSTAATLFQAAESALASRGVERSIGPINLTTHDETGILVEGFESSPVLLSPYNPPYYESLIRNSGYLPHSEYHAFGWDSSQQFSKTADRILKRFSHSQGQSLKIRSFTRSSWTTDIRIIHELYNASFTNTWGFVPISWKEFKQRADQFRQFYRPELCLVAEMRGRAAGFAVVLPDINEALAQIDGRLLPWGWLRVARAIPKINRVRFILIGVLPEFAGQRVALAIVHNAIEAARRAGIQYAELSLVYNQNTPMQNMIRSFIGGPKKTFRLFQKNFRDPVQERSN